MGELTICSHDFENAKRKLKEFSERKTADVQLGQVDAGKDLGEFAWDFVCGRGFGLDHRVTGEELNELTSKVQEKLIDLNKTQIELIQEFREVYNALEALDRDYIYGDVLSLSAVEKQSQVLAREQESIKKITEDLKTNGAVLKQEQEKNDAMLLELSKTAKVLTLFKQRLEQCAHLEEIDKMWEALSEQEHAVKEMKSELEAQDIRFSSELLQQNDALEAVARKSEENAADARAEIDKMRAALSEQERAGREMESELEAQDVRLSSELLQQNDALEAAARKSEENAADARAEIDKMRAALSEQERAGREMESELRALLETQEVRFSSELQQRDEALAAALGKSEENAAAARKEIEQRQEAVIEALNQKIKNAYWLGGSSAATALISIVMLLRMSS